MIRRLRSLVSVWVVVALVAGASVLSAAHMAPDRDLAVRQAAVLTTGFADALCGIDAAGHEYHCPFCHKLPEPPEVAAPGTAARITRTCPDLVGADLVRGPQHIDPHVSSRGPPAAAEA